MSAALSQEDVEGIVVARLAREREQSGQRILAAVTRERQRLEREHAEQIAAVVGTLTQRIRSLVAHSIAADVGFIGPTVAVRNIELGDIEVSQLGVLDEELVRERLTALAIAEPWMTHPEPTITPIRRTK